MRKRSRLYEEKIKRIGNAGRNGGEYYTPRPLIRAIVQVVNPKTGETVYDPEVGSAGFLCEAFEFMRKGGAEAPTTSKVVRPVRPKAHLGRCLAGGVPASAAA